MFTHPQVVHFPIAFLLLAFITEFTSYFWNKDFFSKMSLILLFLGTIGAFAALQSGENAENQAKLISGIDSVLENHEETAKLVFYLYFVLSLIKAAFLWLKKDNLPWRLLIIIGMCLGTFLIIRTAGFGGQLVYEWGAGVNPVMEKFKNTAIPDSNKNYDDN